MSNKFSITGLDKNKKYVTGAAIVIDAKLTVFLRKIEKYLSDSSVDNLHSMRISLRRFRYSLEIFSTCFEVNQFKSVYKSVELLQDLLGESRDLDVISLKISNSEDWGMMNSLKGIYDKIAEEKTRLDIIIKEELIKFIADKNVNKFLNKKGRVKK